MDGQMDRLGSSAVSTACWLLQNQPLAILQTQRAEGRGVWQRCSATRSGLSPPHGLPSSSLLSLIVPGLQGVTFQGDKIRNSSDKQIFFIPNWFLSFFFCLAVVLGLAVGLSAEGCAVRQT